MKKGKIVRRPLANPQVGMTALSNNDIVHIVDVLNRNNKEIGPFTPIIVLFDGPRIRGNFTFTLRSLEELAVEYEVADISYEEYCSQKVHTPDTIVYAHYKMLHVHTKQIAVKGSQYQKIIEKNLVGKEVEFKVLTWDSKVNMPVSLEDLSNIDESKISVSIHIPTDVDPKIYTEDQTLHLMRLYADYCWDRTADIISPKEWIDQYYKS